MLPDSMPHECNTRHGRIEGILSKGRGEPECSPLGQTLGKGSRVWITNLSLNVQNAAKTAEEELKGGGACSITLPQPNYQIYIKEDFCYEIQEVLDSDRSTHYL